MPLAGETVFATDVQSLADATTGRPLVRLVQAVAQTGLAHGSPAAITFTTEDFDTHGYHDPAVNNTRITPTKPGYYRFHGVVFFGVRTDYTLALSYIRKNGATNLPPGGRLNMTGITGSFTFGVIADVIIDMNGTTDYVELIGQSNNAAVAVWATGTGGSGVASTLEAEYLRPL